MKNFNPYKTFQSGKHVNKTYQWVWDNDRGYLHYLADQYDFWAEVVEEFEYRDKIFKRPSNRRPPTAPSVEEFKEYFKKNPIMGFDLSDFLTSVYEKLNELQQEEYFSSLKKRNNLK